MAVVEFKKKGRIAYITLNRPDQMNAMNREVWEGMADAWIKVRDDPEVWTAIVTGAGDKAFSAGADLKEMSEQRAMIERGETPRPRPESGPMRGLYVWKPFIAAVNGFAMGGGFELALACDIRVAAEHAQFGFSEVLRAIIPGAGGTQRLPRMAPFGMAIDLLLTGRRVDAQEAYRLGIVNKVVPLAKLMSTAEEYANMINENGPLAVRAIKESAYRGIQMSLDNGLRLETLFSQIVRQTEDSREGPLAFAQKRKAVYKGK